MTTGIYKITSPSDKIYIGQSRDIYKRWKIYHKNYPSNSAQHKLVNSFNKYGVENHIFEIVEECEFEQLNIRERYWQDFYDVLNKTKGLNLTLTKTDILPQVMSEETRLRSSKAHKGKTHTEKTKKLISEITKGENNGMYGKNHTDEAKKIMSEKATENNTFSKIVLDQNTGIYYRSIREAAKYNGVSGSYLAAVFRGEYANKTGLILT